MILIATAIVAVCALSLAVLRWPHIGTGLLAAFVVTRIPELLEARMGIPTVVLPMAVALAVLTRALQPSPRRPAVVSVVLLMTAEVVLSGVGIAVAQDRPAAIASLWIAVRLSILVVAVVVSLRSTEIALNTVRGIIFSGGVLSLLAVIKGLTGGTQDFLGLASAPIASVVGSVHGYRAAGPVGDPNFFAQLLVVVFAVAFERARHDPSPLVRRISFATAGLTVVAVLATYSRGGLLALAVVAAVFALRAGRARYVVWFALLAALALALVPQVDYLQRLASLTELAGNPQQISDNALKGRLSEMASGAKMFVDHPLIGVGPDNFRVHYPAYSDRIGLDDQPEGRAAHNLILQRAAETGLAGLLILVAAVALSVRGIRRAKRVGGQVGMMAEGLGAALAGFLMAGMFLHLAYPTYFWFVVALCIGIGQLGPNAVRRSARHDVSLVA